MKKNKMIVDKMIIVKAFMASGILIGTKEPLTMRGKEWSEIYLYSDSYFLVRYKTTNTCEVDDIIELSGRNEVLDILVDITEQQLIDRIKF